MRTGAKMTEEVKIGKIYIGEIYEVMLPEDTWNLLILRKRSDGTFTDRDRLPRQMVKTFEVLKRNEDLDYYIMKATRIDDSELFVKFHIEVFIRYINEKELKLVSKPKEVEDHEGMHYNAYSGKWHWGIF